MYCSVHSPLRTQVTFQWIQEQVGFWFCARYHGKGKERTHLSDEDFKLAENNLWKTKGNENESFRVFFCERKVHQLVLKDKIPCPHSSCEKDPQVFQRNGISPLRISSNRFNSTPTLSFCANIITPSVNSWSSSSFFNTAWYCCKTTAASF